MLIKVWGCRGSLPSPGRHTLRYGGNTTCLEIRSQAGDLIILDAGSGARALGKILLKEKALTRLHMIFTHAHWDHLMGFPFFLPAYFRRFEIRLYGGPSTQEPLRKFLAHHMEAPYFPVEFDVMKARFRFGSRHPGTRRIGSLQITSIPQNHPNGGFGYRITENGKSFVFLTDNELGAPHPGGLSLQDYTRYCQGADLLFHDAQYTAAEYRSTRGWGHSTYSDAVALALAAGVKRLGLFHHDPDRSDADLDRQVRRCRQQIKASGCPLRCFACAEGQRLSV